MIPIQPVDDDARCRPRWVHLNHLLSYCTRTLAVDDASAESTGEGTLCRRKDCLFSARRGMRAAG